MRIDLSLSWLPGVLLVLVFTGCAAGRASTAGTPVAVTEIASVVGTWTGLLEMGGTQDREDLVELTVDASGAYRAAAARTIGMMDARGNIAIVGNGKMLLKGDGGSQAMATLYTRPIQPQRTLVVEGATPSGRRFSARLEQRP